MMPDNLSGCEAQIAGSEIKCCGFMSEKSFLSG